MLSAIGDSTLGITNIGGVSAMWGPMSAEPGVDDVDCSRIKVAATGAESVPESMPQEWIARGLVLQEVCGTTESSGVSCITSNSDLPKHIRNAGRALLLSGLKVMRSETE